MEVLEALGLGLRRLPTEIPGQLREVEVGVGGLISLGGLGQAAQVLPARS